MSKYQYISALERELQKLNESIDRKIVQGQRYSFESRRHKMIQDIIRKNKRRRFFAKFLPLVFKY